MPIRPGKSENEEQFISRCMSEESESFPDEPKRYAVCKSYYDREQMSKIKDTKTKVMARIAYDSKFEGINLVNLGENSDACWENYIQVGTKILDGREVPDCRGPVETE
jgi:hypothetical protein